MSVSYGGDSIVFADGSVNASGFIGHRNRIINGAMVIDQRNAGAAVTNTYTVDRFSPQVSSGTLTFQQTTSVVPTGFAYALGITVTSVGTRNAGDFFDILQNIEGLNVSDLGFGAAGAVTVTLSFWVRSSVTGTYSGVVASGDNTGTYSFTYTINSANTWEYKTITIPGDTAGGSTAYPINNTSGLRLKLDLGSGSNFQIATGSWQAATNKIGTSSQVGWAQTAGATFYITGVQLERGSTASSFEYRSIGTELALCQRYYFKTFPQATAPAQNTGVYAGAISYVAVLAGANYMSAPAFFPVVMRATPTTITFYNPGAANAKWRNGSLGSDSGNAATNAGASQNGFLAVNNPQVSGDGINNTIYVHATAEAEL